MDHHINLVDSASHSHSDLEPDNDKNGNAMIKSDPMENTSNDVQEESEGQDDVDDDEVTEIDAPSDTEHVQITFILCIFDDMVL